MVFKRLENGVFHRLGDKGKSMSVHSNDSRRRSCHNSRSYTKSCYQSSRSSETEFTSEKHHNKRASSRRKKALSESEENYLQQKNSLKILSKSTTSSREMGNPWKSLCGEVRWRPLIVNERSHFRRRNRKKLDRSKTSRREAFGTNKGRSESKIEGKLSHSIKEPKQSNGKDQEKAAKKGKTSGKDKLLAILMEEDETKGPMIIEAEMGGFIHCMYVDGGSSLEIMYEHCFNKFCPEVRNQMVPTSTPLVGFSGEIIWPLGQTSLLVKIGDEEHSTFAWMNFMVVRSPSPYNGIIGRPGEAISAVLMMERDGKQVPIYFICRALQGLEISYTPMKKLILALSFELEEHDIHYRPRTSVKGQILVDFIVERLEDDPSDIPMENEEELPNPWILFTDESSCIDGSGFGLILTNPEGMKFTYALRFRFDTTNNKAEYKALIAGLWIAEQMGVKNFQANVDSRLVANQVNGTYIAKDRARHDQILGEEEKRKARTIRRNAGRYAVTNEILYKKSFLGPWLWCVGPLQANYVLREIHEGSCSMHASPRSVVAKALRSGYYWPTMHKDANKLKRECNSCQGVDIARPFLEGPGKVKFLIVAINYFTKWIEATPVVAITRAQIKKFVWDNIFCRFGLPREIISDNEKQFRDNPFKDWCEKLCIRQCFASVKHPQNNGLTLWKREESMQQSRKQKAKLRWKKYYNARVRNTSFKPRDLVYWNNEASHAEDGGKLGPKWKGPYEVTEALGKGAYKLRDRNGNILPRT
nr:reverse transcriptase domain-containing protein [Tanacetum cinerariifolium]